MQHHDTANDVFIRRTEQAFPFSFPVKESVLEGRIALWRKHRLSSTLTLRLGGHSLLITHNSAEAEIS